MRNVRGNMPLLQVMIKGWVILVKSAKVNSESSKNIIKMKSSQVKSSIVSSYTNEGHHLSNPQLNTQFSGFSLVFK